jgi:hypothetical protein
VHILGDHQHRRPPSDGGQQLQGRQPHQRYGRSHPLTHPQRRAQRIPQTARQPIGFGQYRPQQLVQPGKRQVRLARDPRAGQYPHPALGRAPDGHPRQRRLPDPRVAEHQQ